MDRNIRLKQIIIYYGVDNQLRKLQEEIFELSQAIIKYETCNYYDVKERDPEETKEHIEEEIADCYVMLGQFKEHYNLDDKKIENIIDYKIQRTLDRIEGDE